MTASLPPHSRWSDAVDDESSPETSQAPPTKPTPPLTQTEPTPPLTQTEPTPPLTQTEPTPPLTQTERAAALLTGSWRVQGRPRDAVKKESLMRPLLVFACLPWQPRLMFRGVVRGEQGLLELVQRKQYARWHGYDPIARTLVWRMKAGDVQVGVERAKLEYVTRVEAEFGKEVDRAKAMCE